MSDFALKHLISFYKTFIHCEKSRQLFLSFTVYELHRHMRKNSLPKDMKMSNIWFRSSQGPYLGMAQCFSIGYSWYSCYYWPCQRWFWDRKSLWSRHLHNGYNMLICFTEICDGSKICIQWWRRWTCVWGEWEQKLITQIDDAPLLVTNDGSQITFSTV